MVVHCLGWVPSCGDCLRSYWKLFSYRLDYIFHLIKPVLLLGVSGVETVCIAFEELVYSARRVFCRLFPFCSFAVWVLMQFVSSPSVVVIKVKVPCLGMPKVL